jgi:hypothetical protein
MTGGPMLDFIVDILGQVILAVIHGATQSREVDLLARKIPERAPAVRRRRRLMRKQQKHVWKRKIAFQPKDEKGAL